MTKIGRIHYHRAQRIYDRLGRGSVADIDAIAAALVAAHQDGIREGKRQAADLVFNATISTRHHPHDAYVEQPVMHREVLSAMILSTITDEAR